MKTTITRRTFMKTAGFAGTALTAGSRRAIGQEGKAVTLAFVGCAHIHTPGFIKLLNGRKDVRVKWVWDHDPDRAVRRAGELRATVAGSLGQVWSDAEISGVVICSETNRHFDLVTAAAGAGKHMFVEKPLGINSKESYAMAAAIERAGLLFTTGYFMRTAPHHLFLKREVEKGSFGRITRVRASNCHGGSLGGWFDKEWRWMADPKIAGVGGFGDLGTHVLDILMWLFGDVESVTADIKVVTKRYGDCDESGEALLKFANGVTGVLAAGWVDVANPVSLILSGTDAHAMVMNDQLYYVNKKVEGANGKAPFTELPVKLQAPLDMFVDAVGGKRDLPLVTPGEAAARVSVMEAIYRGSREQRWVRPA